MSDKLENSEVWHNLLMNPESPLFRRRRLWKYFSKVANCAICSIPFDGVAGFVTHNFMGVERSNLNPRFCNNCENMVKNYPGGAELTLTMLFADVRGSTALAESMSIAEFTKLMNRFYAIGTSALSHTDALIEKFIGDEVAGLYIPLFTNGNHARRALEAAQDILHRTGHGDEGGSWLSVGVGIHTGEAFVGSVGSAGVTQFTVLGDAPNTTARLASKAAGGEILLSDASAEQAGIDVSGMEHRMLELKGRAEPLGVYVLHVDTPLQ